MKILTCGTGTIKPGVEPFLHAAGLLNTILWNGFKEQKMMGVSPPASDLCQCDRPTCVTDFVQQAFIFFVPGVQVLIWATGQTHTVRGRSAFRRQVSSLNGEDNVPITNKTLAVNVLTKIKQHTGHAGSHL